MSAGDRGEGATLKRVLRALGLLVAAAGLILVVLYVFRGALVAPRLIGLARQHAAEHYGAELSIGGVEGSWFGDVTVTDIAWVGAQPPLLRAAASEVRVEFSTLALLRGEPDWLRAVEAVVEEVTLAAGETSTESPPPPPVSLPPLNLRLGELRYQLDEARALSAQKTRVRIVPSAGADAVEVRAAAVTWRDAERELTESLEVRGSYDDGRIAIEEARFGEVLRATAVHTELGQGDWRAMLLEAAGHVELRHAGELQLALDMEFDDGRAALEGDVRTAGGNLHVRRGELVLGRDRARLFEEARLDVLLDADFDDVGPLGAIWGFDWHGSLEGVLDVEGPVTAPVGVLAAVGEGLRVDTIELGAAELDVRADGRRVEIVRCDFATRPWSGSLSGTWLAQELAFEALEVHLRGGGEELVPGFAPEEFELALSAAGAPASLAGHFEASGAGVPLGPLGDARLTAGGAFEGRSVAVERLVLAWNDRTLRLGGRGGQDADGYYLDLDQLLLEGGDGTLELEAASHIALRGGVLHIDELFLRSEVDGRGGSLRARTKGVVVDLLLDEFDPRPLIGLAHAGAWSVGGLHGTVTGSMDPDAPDLVYDLEVRGFAPRPRAPTYDFVLRGALTPERVFTAVFEGGSDEVTRLRLELRAPYDPREPGELFGPGDVRLALEAEELRLDVLGDLLDETSGASGLARASLELAGSWGNLGGVLTAEARGVRTPESDAALGAAIDVALEAEVGETVVLRRARIGTGERELVNLEGLVHARFDLREWLADPGSLARAPLELEADLALPLGGWAERTSAVRRLDGRLTGRAAIRGSAAQPAFTGHLELRAGELRLASAFPALHAINADIDLDGRTATIVELRGEIGAAPCGLTGRLDWTSDGLVVDLALSGKNLLLARSSEVKVRADAELTLRGPLAGLAAEGAVILTEGRFVQDIDVLASLALDGGGSGSGGWRPSFWTAPPLADMRLDVRLTAADDFDLRGNLYHVVARPDLFLRGTGRVPSFEGRVYIGESSVSLPSGRAIIPSGVLQFSPDRPYTPELSISAETRSRGYDITAQVTGTSDAPEILLSSVPALPNDELLVLFLTGQLAVGEDRLGAAESIGAYLAQDYVTRMLFGGSVEGEENLLDRLVFEIGADVSRSGAPTARGIYYLAPQRTRTGAATYLLAEQDKYDKTNFGFGLRFRFR